MSHTAPQRPSVPEGSVRNFIVTFSIPLDSGELLTGTPTVVDSSPNSPEELTITNKVVNTAILTLDNGDGSTTSVPIGEAVQFSVSGMLAATGSYTINITVGTDATPAQTLPGKVIFDCH